MDRRCWLPDEKTARVLQVSLHFQSLACKTDVTSPCGQTYPETLFVNAEDPDRIYTG
jgi:hypothetical protein